ncbi:MAG: hypothetical protein IPG97_06435 [Microthrixaceae bacterium]|nr:hypothetical protein [Microthrixaceae bacterium]
MRAWASATRRSAAASAAASTGLGLGCMISASASAARRISAASAVGPVHGGLGGRGVDRPATWSSPCSPRARRWDPSPRLAPRRSARHLGGHQAQELSDLGLVVAAQAEGELLVRDLVWGEWHRFSRSWWLVMLPV